MATTVHEPPKIDPRRLPETKHSGNGGWRNLVPADGDLRMVQHYSPPASSTGIWVVLFAITMMFAAFTSALVVRKGASLDWRHFTLPSILYFNTLLLLASSVTLEVSRRRVAAFMGGSKKPVGESGTMALHHIVPRPAFCGWSVHRVAATECPRPFPGDKSQQFVFLCAHCCPCAAYTGRLGRDHICHTQAQPVGPAAQHTGCHRPLLAFYGCALGIPAAAPLDEALTN